MDLQAWASLISVVVAIVAVFYAGNSAYASMDSAALARDSATAAAEQVAEVKIVGVSGGDRGPSTSPDCHRGAFVRSPRRTLPRLGD